MSWIQDALNFIAPPQAWQVFTPELVILLFALLSPLVALWDTDRRGMQQFTLVGLIGAFLITLGTLFQFSWGPFSLAYIDWSAGAAADGHATAVAFRVTEASQVFKLLFLGTAITAVIGVGRPFKGQVDEEDWGEFFALLLFATLGMMVVASARELITLFLGVEMVSLSSYLMAAFKRDRRGAEAGIKYFVIGAISSGATLFAISLLYGAAGTTVLPELGVLLTTGGTFGAVGAVASVLLLAGLGFKISSVPFHAWAPDVYHGAPAPVAGVLAAASKAMGFVAVFSVFLVGLAGLKPSWEVAVALLAAASMFVGNLIAIQQKSVVRMLAYSSIAQAGYLLIAVAVGTWFAVGGGILHLMVNAAMKLGAFLIVGALLTLGVPDTVDGYKGLGKRAPFLAFAMAAFLLSMAGIPPLGGFTSKFVLFSSAIDAGIVDQLGWLIWLAVIAVVNSAISLFYYLRIIRAMYVEQGADDHRLTVPAGATVAVSICLAAVLLIGLWPDVFVEAAMGAAISLLP